MPLRPGHGEPLSTKVRITIGAMSNTVVAASAIASRGCLRATRIAAAGTSTGSVIERVNMVKPEPDTRRDGGAHIPNRHKGQGESDNQAST